MTKVRLRRISIAEAQTREWNLVVAKPGHHGVMSRRDFPAVLEYQDAAGHWTEAKLFSEEGDSDA